MTKLCHGKFLVQQNKFHTLCRWSKNEQSWISAELGTGCRPSLKRSDFQLILYLLYYTPVLWNSSLQEFYSQLLQTWGQGESSGCRAEPKHNHEDGQVCPCLCREMAHPLDICSPAAPGAASLLLHFFHSGRWQVICPKALVTLLPQEHLHLKREPRKLKRKLQVSL